VQGFEQRERGGEGEYACRSGISSTYSVSSHLTNWPRLHPPFHDDHDTTRTRNERTIKQKETERPSLAP
jgi:hypothetical protein